MYNGITHSRLRVATGTTTISEFLLNLLFFVINLIFFVTFPVSHLDCLSSFSSSTSIINFCLRSYPRWEAPHWLFSIEALEKTKQCSKPQPGIGSVWKSIWGSVISPRVPVMISFWFRCVALFPFFPLSVFPICLWVSLSTKCELLFVPPYSPPLAFSPSYPLLFRAAFKLAECDW